MLPLFDPLSLSSASRPILYLERVIESPYNFPNHSPSSFAATLPLLSHQRYPSASHPFSQLRT